MDVIEIDDDESRFEFIEAKPRKIMFCIDTSAEMSEILNPSAKTGARDSNLYYSSRIETTQRFLKRYANMNEMIGNDKDEYGMITLTDVATWWYDFSPNVSSFNEEIGFLDSQVVEHYDTLELDIGSLFRTIEHYMDPNSFNHVIVIYGRADVMPEGNMQIVKEIRKSPNLTMDLIYLHDSTDSVQKIYDFWASLDSEIRPGWYYETGTYLGKDKMAKALCELISHPLQRGEQEML
ncbi:hypothetical protein BDF21DRAFT_461137 [Thamnidium elegans]|uniref:BRISC and BRCA1-A complex member 1 n=1 Tax=Thamnidium elegans TaxID=101142 RepID=A0A8H7SQE7_9FUNG|nr:hypothetical protein INT48_000341 [Thamnidium elegans]KAI8087518.1 hypothetical protein BDF21DRAFT_461137 [Thamnidium elegans]